MIKKTLIIVGFLLSPFISLVALTPISMIPAILLANLVTQNECANVKGENLCGFGQAIVYGFLLNAIIGYIITICLSLHINNSWKSSTKFFSSIILLVYFTVIIGLIFHIMIQRPYG